MTITILPVQFGGTANENTQADIHDFSNHDMPVHKFKTGVDSEVYIYAIIPTNLSGTITAVKVRFSVFSETANNVGRFAVAPAFIADGESLVSPTLTDETAEDITLPATASQRKDSADVTLSGTKAKGDNIVLRLKREGAHANDTHADWVQVPHHMFELEVTH